MKKVPNSIKFARLVTNFALLTILFAVVIPSFNPLVASGIVTLGMWGIERLAINAGFNLNLTGYAFNIVYTPVEMRGKVVQDIFLELFYKNETLDKGLVTFQDDVKYDTIFSDAAVTVNQQAWTSGTPVASGSISLSDTQIVPIKVEYYDEFNPDALRAGRYKTSMPKGAWETMSDEFQRQVLDNLIAGKVSADAESKFWNAAKAATQATVAGLVAGVGQGSVGAAEQAYVASLTASQFDGVVTRMIYNNAAVGGRYKVAGTTIDSTNIVTEYKRAYDVINPLQLQDNEAPVIYAPKSHKLMIVSFNLSTTFKDVFVKSGNDYFFGDLKIVFVPLPENCLIIAKPSDIHWCTDTLSDVNLMKIMPVANFSKTWGYDIVFTEFAHITHQSMNVLYLG